MAQRLENKVAIVTGAGGALGAASEQGRDQTLQADLQPLFLTCKHCLPVMRRQGAGAIVNVSTIAGLRTVGPPAAANATSQAAVIRLPQSLALEHAAQANRCNALVLSLQATLYLASGEAKYVTGTSLVVDGGITARVRP